MSILDKFLSFQPCKIYCRQTYSYMETVKKETSILSGNTFVAFNLPAIAIIWHSIHPQNDKIFGGCIKWLFQIFCQPLNGSIYREHILDFMRVDYASVWECQFTVLECSTVARSYEVTDTLWVFKMPVLMIWEPVYALCHSVIRCEVSDINKTVSAFYEETEYECFYLLV